MIFQSRGSSQRHSWRCQCLQLQAAMTRKGGAPARMKRNCTSHRAVGAWTSSVQALHTRAKAPPIPLGHPGPNADAPQPPINLPAHSAHQQRPWRSKFRKRRSFGEAIHLSRASSGFWQAPAKPVLLGWRSRGLYLSSHLYGAKKNSRSSVRVDGKGYEEKMTFTRRRRRPRASPEGKKIDTIT